MVYNPPNLTYPYGCYICVVDVDRAPGQVKVRRFIAVDDCGTHQPDDRRGPGARRPLADGIGMALMEVIAFDGGNNLGGSFMDYLLPTSMECPDWELGETGHALAAPPDRRQRGVGESATVGSPAAVVNAVIDAIAPFGVRHADMPLTPANVARDPGPSVRTDLAVE